MSSESSAKVETVRADHPGLFARQATGLVREVSTTSALFMNWLSGFPPFVLGVGIFFILSAFPGANLYGTYGIAALIGVPILLTIGLLSSVIPRSGGDWVTVTRVLGPYVGIVSSVCALSAFVLAASFLAFIFPTAAVGPSLAALGLVSGSETLTSWADTVTTSRDWGFAVAVVMVLVMGLLHLPGVRVALTVLRWGAVFSLLGFLVTGIVALARSGSDFAAVFNSFAEPVTGNPDTYNGIIDSATAAGIDLDPPFSLTATWIASGIVLGQVIYNYLALYVSGEVRRANSFRVTATMVGSLLATCSLLAVYTLIFFHSWGGDFLTAINGINGTEDYPFSAPPFYVFLAAIAGENDLLAWIIALSFTVNIPLLILVIFFLPTRILFSWAFDGLLPLRLSAVSARRGVPYYALAITFVLIIGGLVWAVYGSEAFLTVLAYVVVFQLTSMFFLCLSATVLPYRLRDVWRAATTARTVGPLPLSTLSGVFGMAAIIATFYVFFTYPELGISDKSEAFTAWGIVAGTGLAFFIVSRSVRAARGEDLTRVYTEIPPE